jgi:hypothetical protein
MTTLMILLLAALEGPRHLNLSSQVEPSLQQLAGQGQVSYLVVGDSLSREGWTQPFAAELQQRFGNAGGGYQGLARANLGGFNGGVWDAHAVKEDRAPHSGLDGLWAETIAGLPTPGQSTTALLTPWQAGPVQVQYVRQPSGGRFQILEDIGQQRILRDTIDSAADSEGLATWSGTATGRLVFQPLDAGKQVKILGIVGQSDEPGVRVDRVANDSWGSANLIQRDWTFDEQVKLLDNDVAFIMLGQNEQVDQVASYGQKIEIVVDRLLAANPDMGIVLVSTYDSGGPSLDRMSNRLFALAEQREWGFINLYAAAGDHDFFVRNDFLRDAVNWNAAGSEYVARIVVDAVLSRGASLDQPRGDVDGDGRTDLNDFGIMKAFFGVGTTLAQGDVTKDGQVDLNDFGVLKQSFGLTPISVAEPAGWSLAAAWFVATWSIVRCRHGRQ